MGSVWVERALSHPHPRSTLIALITVVHWYRETLRLPAAAGARKTGLDHVGTVPSVREAGGNYDPGEEVSGAGAQFAFALLPVHQPRNDSVWTILLEPGMPVLPGVLPVAGWRRVARDAELQV